MYSCMYITIKHRIQEAALLERTPTVKPDTFIDCTFKSSCLGMMVILFPSMLRTVPFKLARSPSATSTTSPVTNVCLSSSVPSREVFIGTVNKIQYGSESCLAKIQFSFLTTLEALSSKRLESRFPWQDIISEVFCSSNFKKICFQTYTKIQTYALRLQHFTLHSTMKVVFEDWQYVQKLFKLLLFNKRNVGSCRQ